MGRPHQKTAKPIMQSGPSTAQKGIAKKRGTRQLREKPRSVDDMSRNNKKKQTNLRDRATVKRLLMYREKAPEHRVRPESGMRQAKVAPNRRWFGNTRVIGQNELTQFREELANKVNDPYTVLLKGKKLPLSLLTDPTMTKPVRMLDVESFEETFSKKRKRKRPKLAGNDLGELLTKAEAAEEGYDENKDSNLKDSIEYSEAARENIMNKGQSKRIWAELHKVVDSSDVVIQVLDVRDPIGTRVEYVEQLLKRPTARHKHMVLLLNKCDLVPTWVTARWIKILSAEYPTLAFHASITNPFGKGALIQLLRQFKVLHGDKKHLSVGFFGYPNVGKSSIINTLRKKRVCKAAPTPGETKVWQYVTLFRGIYLIDCPGTVYGSGDSDLMTVMKGVVRVENIDMPSQYVEGVLQKVKEQYLKRTYMLPSWKDAFDFLEKLARKFGKLWKGNEPDIETTAKMVLNDLIRGKLPFFEEPPAPPTGGFGYTKKDLRALAVKERERQLAAANAPSEQKRKQLQRLADPFSALDPGPSAKKEEQKESEVVEEEEEEEEEEPHALGQVVGVKQRLSKLLCTHMFDNDDMKRGDGEVEAEEDEDEDGFSSAEEEEGEEEEEEEEEERNEGGEEDGSGSDVSLNDEESEEEVSEEEDDEEAAAEAAWKGMEEDEEEGGAGAGAKAGGKGEDKGKINRTLLRRRRNAEKKKKDGLTWNQKRIMNNKKPARDGLIPGREALDQDSLAYGKRPRPGRKAVKRQKIGNHFYDRVDVKGKRKRKGGTPKKGDDDDE